jgi:ubiquitin C-terminal hydrolase
MSTLLNEAHNRRELSASAPITIDECMKLFTTEEELTERNLWYCPRCKTHVRATKQMHVWKLPNILIIQLKRFKQNEHSSLRRKNDVMVDCPLR